MMKINFEKKFEEIEKDIFNNQKKVNNKSNIKVYYGLTKEGYERLSFLSTIAPPEIESTKMLKVIQGKEGENVYWTCFDLLNSDFKKIFYSFSEDIVNSISDLDNEKAELNMIKDRFYIWKVMFKKIANSLSTEKEQGLFGELFFLNNYMISKYGVNQSIKSWAGPLGFNKDFSIDETWYEVKTISVNSIEVKITSLSQLSSNIVGNLSIVRVEKMSNEFTGSQSSILDIFNDILLKTDSSEIKEILIKKMIEYGFNPESEYQKSKFDVKNISIYKVDDSFPKLLESDIKYQEIDNVTYQIIIKTIEKFKVEEL